MGAARFTDLRVYEAANDLCAEIYTGLPAILSKRSSEWLQMRRAAASIGANTAEGFGRWAPKDQARFYEISEASAEELRHFVFLSARLGYLKPDPVLDRRLDSICGMLVNLRKAVLARLKV